MNSNTIPIFFTIDDGYAPYLDVALCSMIENVSREHDYTIYVLYQHLSKKNKDILAAHADEHFSIEFRAIHNEVDRITDRIENRLRHNSFTLTIYYRLFIADMFPQYEKGIYIDSDVVVPGDISELFQIDLGDNYVAGCVDHSVEKYDVIMNYYQNAVGVSGKEYINSGVLLMNLKEIREKEFSKKFLDLLCTYHFDSVAPDQDYINAIFYGKILHLDECWNTMPVDGEAEKKNPKLIHYNLFKKPWSYDTPYDAYFWHYAEKSYYYKEILSVKENYNENQIKEDEDGFTVLMKRATEIPTFDVTFKKVMESGEQVRI